VLALTSMCTGYAHTMNNTTQGKCVANFSSLVPTNRVLSYCAQRRIQRSALPSRLSTWRHKPHLPLDFSEQLLRENRRERGVSVLREWHCFGGVPMTCLVLLH